MHRYAPVFVLALLSPFIAEVLFGATPISRLGSLIPVIALYGGGAVLIRELVRARGLGWGAVLMLGAAYGIVEEGLALQSLFNPALFEAGALGGRWLGVNWVWSEWTIGYHAVFSIALPILLTELAFPARKADPWLGRAGRIVAGAFFGLGAIVLGAVFRLFVAPDFTASPLHLAAALAAIGGLAAAALGRRAQSDRARGQANSAAGRLAWPAAGVGFVGAALWFGLLKLPLAWRADAWVWLPMAGALLPAYVVGARLGRWRRAPWWSDRHDLALAYGALVTLMAWGQFFVTAGNRLDQWGQGLLALGTLAAGAVAAVRLRRRAAPES